MAVLTFENYKDKIATTILKKAEKLVVRDLDEENPNHFIAYVDEGDVSFDVSIIINAKKEIISTACDCDNISKMCIHKIAFLNFFLSKKTTKTKIIRKKKLSETEELIQNTSENELKIWVLNLFKTNKDLELLFKAEFNKTSISYDTKSVKIIIDTSIKSIIKNRKNIDTSEITKIVKLLEVSLLPVINYTKDTISLLETHSLLYFIYNEIIDFHNRIYSSSIKLIRLYEKIYKDVIHHIQTIQNQQNWEFVLQNYFSFFDEVNKTSIHFDLLEYFYESIPSSERKKIFTKHFFVIYKDKIVTKGYFSVEFYEFVLKVLSENELFEHIYNNFKAIKYANRYNILLIEKLLEINKIDEATKIAEEQIQINSNDYYNSDYYKILEPIYSKTNNLSKLALIDLGLIQEDFSFERYLRIKENWKKTDKEFVLFRTSILTKCRRNFHENSKAKILYFNILNSYGNYKLMFDNINENIDYEVIYIFKEILFAVNSLDFLTSLNNISYENHYLKKESREKENDFRQKLLNWILNQYDELILRRVAIVKHPYRTTFFEAIKQHFDKK